MPVSVVIPSYNHAPFIAQTLRSIFKQSLLPKELIVVDDGSKDESVKIIEKILQDAPFPAKLIARENRGLCATLNEGFALSSGEYFAYISSDDLWLPGFLENRLKVLKSRPDALASYGHSYLIDEQNQIFENTEDWGEYIDGNILKMLLIPRIPASASLLYRRSALEKVRWNENSVLEDYELYLQLSTLGDFALDKNILSAWRIHSYNASGEFLKMTNEWFASQDRLREEIGLSHQELKAIQMRCKFNCAADFIRRGDKATAFRLFWENIGGASSPSAIAKMLFKFAMPRKALQSRREMMKQKAIEKYGKIEI